MYRILKRVKGRSLMATLLLAFLFVTFSTNINAETEEFFPETQAKLTGMNQKETETLQRLFDQVQAIEELEKEALNIAKTIDGVRTEIADLQSTIAKEEQIYTQKENQLKQLLQSYQRMGPGSYLEIILESKDLSDFLRRINTLREITRSSGELLSQLKVSKEKLMSKRTQIQEKLTSMEDKQNQLEQSLIQQKELKNALEQDLASLSQEKLNYKEYLGALEQNWDNLKPMFSKTASQFTRMIEEGNLPTDAFKISFGLDGIKGSIDDGKLNEILQSYSQLPKMAFKFSRNQAELSIPEHKLTLKGTFDIQEGHTLRFQVKEGSFSGMPLQSGAIEDLFQEGDMRMNFDSMLNGFSLRSVELKDGVLEVSLGL